MSYQISLVVLFFLQMSPLGVSICPFSSSLINILKNSMKSLYVGVTNFRLQGNPICTNSNLVQFCGSQSEGFSRLVVSPNASECRPQSCPRSYEYVPASPVPCFCAAPLLVGYRLKSPGFSDFRPYIYQFEVYLSSGLNLYLYQLDIGSPEWERGPRLRMNLKFFPAYTGNDSNLFNDSEIDRIQSFFTGWRIPDSKIFGPYELLNFTLLDPYRKDGSSPYPSLIIEQKYSCHACYYNKF